MILASIFLFSGSCHRAPSFFRKQSSCRSFAGKEFKVWSMSQIQVNQLSFYYDGSYDDIFKDVSFSIDTDWKLGFVGRNGRGKTTFLNLLLGKYEYRGSIVSPEKFEYFPFEVKDRERQTLEILEELKPEHEFWKLNRELNLLEVDSEVLYRPFDTLSNGEQTKVLLALLFLQEDCFLLIDEPTNHLDAAARQAVSRYLNKKTGFILVSHDRAFLDACIDHVLALNKNTIEVVQGNFTSWWENKKQRDEYEFQENEKLKREVGRLKETARQAANWSDKVEKTKIGQKVAGLKPDRGFIGHKAAKMMKRSKNAENRMERAIGEKEKLLKNVETAEELKIVPLKHYKDVLVSLEDAALGYQGRAAGELKEICSGLTFDVRRGNRIVVAGGNGCGKSTILKAILNANGNKEIPCQPVLTEGRIETASGLVISYIAQDTSWLSGTLSDFTSQHRLDDTLFRAILRKLDFSREQFDKEMEIFSEGQKKKVLLAKSFCEKAHLYIWDEPLNFIDVFSRMQIEDLIERYGLTMIFVEHDAVFAERIATKQIRL